MPRTPKTLVAIEIPTKFVNFMQEVARQIANRDEATTIESDDLLQCDCAYGGLCDPARQQFCFRYFHAPEATWDLFLDASEIQAIADGAQTHLSLWHCSDPQCPFLYPTEDSYCRRCDSFRHFDQDFPQRLRNWYPDEPPAVIDALTSLRQIVLAILDYVRDHDDRFPPPFTKNENGERLHSWRSLILPYLDLDSIYAAIDFNEPWNSPRNLAVGAQTPRVYAGADTAPGDTPFAAVVGPDTLWPPHEARQLSDITGAFSYLVAAVCAPTTRLPWMEPQDVDVETLTHEVTANDGLFLASYIDGSTKLYRNVTPAQLRELVSIKS